uniref:Uncharacterized protein n=3 Tax=Sus scrofa TaxID=9823 RepID=A0A8D0WCE9_PIG
MIDGCPAATSLSPETYLADVQVGRYSRSLLVHHPTTINHNYVSAPTPPPIYTALHSNMGSEPHLQPTPQLMTMPNPLPKE